MPSSDDFQSVRQHLLRAYDELTLALSLLNLQTIKTVRGHVLDCYWLVNEMHLNPVADMIDEVDDGEPQF